MGYKNYEETAYFLSCSSDLRSSSVGSISPYVTPKLSFMPSYFESLARKQFHR